MGDDLDAVRVVAAAARTVAARGISPLADAALAGRGPDRFVADGRVDVRSVRGLEPTAAAAAAAVSPAADDVRRIDLSALTGPVRGPVARAVAGIVGADRAVDLVHTTTRLLPPMLGADGRRTYLLVFQNLAEARPTGGIFGAWASIGVEDGRIELIGSGVNNDLDGAGLDLSQVEPALLEVYGPDVALSQNMNLSAHFPSAARLIGDLWVAGGNSEPDGVVSLDPVVLSAVLRATGPVDVPGGPRLTGRNAVQVLQSDVYRLLGGAVPAREAYLGSAVSAVFERFVQEASVDAFARLVGPAGAGHIRVWSARPQEQDELRGDPIGGALPEPDEGTVGVFTTNADGSKLDHYVTRSVRVLGGCGDDPVVALAVANDAPARVPRYVAAKEPGSFLAGSSPTTHVLVASLYLPPQRGVRSLTVDGEQKDFSVDTERGWTLVRVPLTVAAGTTADLRVRLSGAPSAPDTVLVPPGVDDPPVELAACQG